MAVRKTQRKLQRKTRDTRSMLTALEKRVQQLEDEAAIREVVVRYGFSVDTGDVDAMQELYTRDTVVDVDNRNIMKGEEIRNIVLSPTHQAMLPNCSHMGGPFVIEWKGKRAIMTGYSMVLLRDGDGGRVWRQSTARWEMEKRDGKWKVVRRLSYGVGKPGAHDMFRQALGRT